MPLGHFLFFFVSCLFVVSSLTMKNVSPLSLLDCICHFLMNQMFPKSSFYLSFIICLLLCLMHIVYAGLCLNVFLFWFDFCCQSTAPLFIWGCTGNQRHRPTLFNTACSHGQCLIESKKDTLHITVYIVHWTSRRGRWVSLPVGKLSRWKLAFTSGLLTVAPQQRHIGSSENASHCIVLMAFPNHEPPLSVLSGALST